jgi:hypothetical protein
MCWLYTMIGIPLDAFAGRCTDQLAALAVAAVQCVRTDAHKWAVRVLCAE